jgi:hypothetical protein
MIFLCYKDMEQTEGYETDRMILGAHIRFYVVFGLLL